MTGIGNIWMEGLIFLWFVGENHGTVHKESCISLCTHFSIFQGYFRCAATRARRIKDQKDLEAATGLVDTGHISSLPGASLERRTGVSRERWTIV